MERTDSAAGLDVNVLAQVGPTLQGIVDEGKLSGAVTLIWRRGHVAQVNAVGHRDLGAGLPMERDTLFRIASMTKPVTSLAVMMLIEEGKLALGDPVTRWLPELSNMRVLKVADGPMDEVTLSPRDITVEDLLTHRAGLTYGFASAGPIAEAYDILGSPMVNALSPDEWLKRLGSLPLIFPPGDRFHYSHATDVLGFLVARIEGASLGHVLKEKIFDPLAMTDTMFWVPPEKRDRLARIYKARPEGGALEDASLPHTVAPPAFEGGGAGLISTADDYLRFARLLLGRGEVDGLRLVAPETIELMTANRMAAEDRRRDFFGMPFWRSQGFGLGLSMILDPEQNEWLGPGAEGSFGWPGAFGTWWQADPKHDMILIFLMQDSPSEAGPESFTGVRNGRPTGRVARSVFHRLAYSALGR